MHILFFTLYFIASIYGALQTFGIYADDLSNNKIKLGRIEYDPNTTIGEFIKDDETESLSGKFCIGTPDLDDMNCFAYVSLGSGGDKDYPSRQFYIYLKQDNSIDYISYPVSSNSKVQVIHSVEAPVPNLHPSNKQSSKGSKEPKKTIIKKTAKDEDGNLVEIEEEEIVDERSWLQKNWVYVVIPLVLLFLSSDDKNQKK